MGDAYADAETSVWWDINQCPIPEGEEGVSVVSNIRYALLTAGYRGRVSIFAFGDFCEIPDAYDLKALFNSKTHLRHMTHISFLLGDPFLQMYTAMYEWADKQQGLPCNCLIASGDQAYSGAINQLKVKKVNVLLAHPLMTSCVLTDAADNAWVWDSFLAGEPPYKSILGSQESFRTTDPNPKGKQPTKEIPL